MAIITISRGSYSRGKEVAEKVAKKLGYDCISRDILLDASEQFNISKIKLQRAIHDAPSILDDFTYGKERYIAYIQAALLKYLREDNIVYHGLAGHFFVKDVPNVLKVRIIADMEDRIRLEMEREKISHKEAMQILAKDDEQRIKWSKHLYGIDSRDSSLYDLVVHIKRITVDDAVNMICHAVSLDQFQTTPESTKLLNDLALAAEVKAVLIEQYPNIEVNANDGTVAVHAKANPIHMQEMTYQLEKTAKTVLRVKDVKIDIAPISLYAN